MDRIQTKSTMLILTLLYGSAWYSRHLHCSKNLMQIPRSKYIWATKILRTINHEIRIGTTDTIPPQVPRVN